jgi:predicted Zn-dependent protease
MTKAQYSVVFSALVLFLILYFGFNTRPTHQKPVETPDTESVENQVAKALGYAENPPPDNPMKAVLMLRDLEAKHPDNPAVYNALGRLAIKTGQWQKAIDRLEKAWSLDKNNPTTPCLLQQAYEGAGQPEKSSEFARLCK